MKYEEIMDRLAKLQRSKNTQAFVDLAIEAKKSGFMNPDLGQIIANSAYDGREYVKLLGEAMAKLEKESAK